MVQTIVLQLEDIDGVPNLDIPHNFSIVSIGLDVTNPMCRVVLADAIAREQTLEKPVAFRDALSYLIDLEDDTLTIAHRVVEALYNAKDVPALRGLLETACKAVPWRPLDDESPAVQP